MTREYPSIVELETRMPEYVDHWKKSVDHAEVVFESLVNREIRHTDYPYQQLKDVWQMVLHRWDEMAAAPAAVNLQEEIAAGSRVLRRYCISRLETLRNYDNSPYRTVWIGQGQPNDPYDDRYPSIV